MNISLISFYTFKNHLEVIQKMILFFKVEWGYFSGARTFLFLTEITKKYGIL